MNRITRYLGQAAVYAIAAAFVAYFASHPVYRQVPEGQAQIKLLIKHGGVRLEECRRLTPEELAKLPSTQRRPLDCSRERSPVTVVLIVDGEQLYDAVLAPTGLSGDGQSKAYEKFLLPAGPHVIEARLRDNVRTEGFDYEGRLEADLRPWQNLAVEFNAEKGGFLFR